LRRYAQLTQEQRNQIHAYMKVGFTPLAIAKETGALSSTISCETPRN